MQTYVHALQLNYRGNVRRAPWHQERGAQRPRATLNYNCATTTVGPTRHQGHRRTRGGIEGDARGTEGHKGGSKRHPRDRRAQGGSKRHQGDRRETTGESERAARSEGPNTELAVSSTKDPYFSIMRPACGGLWSRKWDPPLLKWDCYGRC
jgi:hypothetical protein